MSSFLPYLGLLACPLAMGAMMVLMMRRSRTTNENEPAAPVAPQERSRDERPVRYVRNRRPTAIRLWVGGTPFRLAGRGSPGDMLELPAPALNDPDVVAYLDLDWIEEADETVDAAPGRADPGTGGSPAGADALTGGTSTTGRER